jgi:hypothetical protein
MEYPVRCECNKMHFVSAGQCGAAIDCSCGRRVEIPSYGVLKQQTLEGTIEKLSHSGQLSFGPRCVFCDEPTESTVQILITYGEKELPSGISLHRLFLFSAIFVLGGCVTSYIFAFLLWLLVVFAGAWGLGILMVLIWWSIRVKKATVGGRQLRVAVRLCEKCPRTAAALEEYLSQDPLVEKFLWKNPTAKVALAQ